MTINLTLLQTSVSRRELRGRVISIYVLVFTAGPATLKHTYRMVRCQFRTPSGVQPTVLAEGFLTLGIGLLYLRPATVLA